MSEAKSAANSSPISQNSTQNGPSNHANYNDRIIDLQIQEYIALRAEQRTRLDSANKIIHYYAISLAAVIVGLANVYKNGGGEAFNNIFPIVLLSIPVITIPFAFAQQNEEIIVRNIGDYFRQIKSQISSEDDSKYWTWEGYHYAKLTDIGSAGTLSLQITAFFRAGLLIFFSTVSLVIYYFTYGMCMPWTFVRYVIQHWGDNHYALYMGALLFFDWLLISAAGRVGIGMLRARVSLRTVIRTLYARLRGKRIIPAEPARSEDEAR